MLPAVARHRFALMTHDAHLTRRERESQLAHRIEQLIASVPIASLEHADFFDKKHQKIDR